MKVFKFGGASLKNSGSIKNVARIIESFSQEPLVVIVSAIGKTTNALEGIVECFQRKSEYASKLDSIIDYHKQITLELFSNPAEIDHELEKFKNQIESYSTSTIDHDQLYDQVVSIGEMISSRIISAYLNTKEIRTTWVDARKFITTDQSYKEGKVNWAETDRKIKSLKDQLHASVHLTQGFIGGTENNLTTTLGREGSDFSAAIFASALDAESVTIWKDVPGVMSADPKRLPNAVTFDELPFREAAEMTYYGASVIHPKTIKPLANKGIPLFVKNFDNISLPGTRIHECKIDHLPPLIVFKENQCLISCQVTDYTFIDEAQIEIIFKALSERSLKVNLMQNSAISFSFCIDFNERKVIGLIEELSNHFEVYYNTGLTLITVKNYDQETFESYRKKEGIMLEQSSRSTLQVLIKSE